VEDALDRIAVMIEEGATIIDIGGESTRPGAEPVPPKVEMSRVLPILKHAVQQYPETYFSIYTRTYEVAEASLQAGAHIINDVSGLQKEPRLAELCAEYKAGYILMHSQGEPQDMQEDPRYEDVVEDVKGFFRTQIEKARKAGLDDIIIDPGIGFGKTLQHNLTLFAELNQLLDIGCPIMVGASRKSMFDQILGGRDPKERVAATVSAHYDAMMKGARILRVHDVREAHDSVQVFNAIHHGEQKT
jgi:dihydropteroate synthase